MEVDVAAVGDFFLVIPVRGDAGARAVGATTMMMVASPGRGGAGEVGGAASYGVIE